MDKQFTILVNCTDETGLIYRITRILFENGLNIVKNGEFVDQESDHFFMRTEAEGTTNESALTEALTAILPANSKVEVITGKKKKLVILATKENHCLGDLLIRNHFNEWNADRKSTV